MADDERRRLGGILDELTRAVAADDGAALYLDDGGGLLNLAVSTGGSGGYANNLLDRLRGRADGTGKTLTISLPQANGFMILARRSGGDFTQQDRTVARLYARQLTDKGAVAGSPLVHTGWTRQLEAIQRIAARLTRLASAEEVGATICSETPQVIDHDEAHVMVTDAAGRLHSVASAGHGEAVLPLPVTGHVADAMLRSVRAGVPVLAGSVTDLGPERQGTYSMLLAPLHYESHVSGLICLLAKGSQRFDDDDLRLLRILSDQAAVAMENSRLMHGRDELVQELAGLLEISEAAGRAADEFQLATLAARRLRTVTQTDASLVALWDVASTELRVVCRDGIGGLDTIDVAESPARRSVLRDGRPRIIQAESSDVGVEANQLRELGAQTLLLLPLNAGGQSIGLIELLARHQPRYLSEAEMHTCEAMAGLAATGMERVRAADQLRSAADVDLVTGVHNHRYLQERLRQEVARSARSHSPLAVMMLDLDKFKPINDRHGHADGDRVLHNVGATIKSHVRSNDIVARYGGDEFVVLMPDTTDRRAEQVARRVVEGILGSRQPLSDGSTVSVGVSAGLALYPTDGRTSAQLLAAADAAMYTAKRTGGRQVERSTSRLVIEVVQPAPAIG